MVIDIVFNIKPIALLINKFYGFIDEEITF